jgi:hypothetical protein
VAESESFGKAVIVLPESCYCVYLSLRQVGDALWTI